MIELDEWGREVAYTAEKPRPKRHRLASAQSIRKSKLKRQFKGRYAEEWASTMEKAELLRQLTAEAQA